MLERYLILVDDTDQSQTLRNLERKLRENESIKLEYVHINTKLAKYQVYNETNDTQETDVSKIIGDITAVYFFKWADTIALDYNLSDTLKGFELAAHIRKNGYKKAKEIILYSGKIEDAITEILRKDDLKEKINAIKMLNESNIHFATRGDDFSSSVINHIKKNPEFDFDYELLKWMYKFSDKQFIGVFPKYDKKSLGEIAQEIEGNTSLSNEFKKALLEQLFSILVQINELEEL
ncbi:hypothetical protein PFY12_12695 [Chryseobacterium camelliae]|uniref:Response regulatory domain-containing protein n=1 Tax=Chryseobacterium camelliae TaxID=1265445 RepID=A0ABY7QJM5_9FLAO|nr:hypothetical protein [Chryseobacterium camelliae]WBV59898.1 hypothetical protein PFY12_12695 [Chryseobacterium camelliae]